MDELAALAIQAHGGLPGWRKRKQVRAHQSVQHVRLPQITRHSLFDDTTLTLALHRQWTSHMPFSGPALRSSVEPHRVAIESLSGHVMTERLEPRLSFQGQQRDMPWDTLQIAYFIGYTMWMSLTSPFNLVLPGVHCVEIAPWNEYGECWRRLRVRFPPSVATHCHEQVFYFDSAGLLQRHDYDIDVAGGLPVADYVAAHQQVAGIVVPSSRVLLSRLPDNTALPEPSIMQVELNHIVFS